MLKCDCMLVIRCIEHSCVHQRRISSRYLGKQADREPGTQRNNGPWKGLHTACFYGIHYALPILLEHNKEAHSMRNGDGMAPLELAVGCDRYDFGGRTDLTNKTLRHKHAADYRTVY